MVGPGTSLLRHIIVGKQFTRFCPLRCVRDGSASADDITCTPPQSSHSIRKRMTEKNMTPRRENKVSFNFAPEKSWNLFCQELYLWNEHSGCALNSIYDHHSQRLRKRFVTDCASTYQTPASTAHTHTHTYTDEHAHPKMPVSMHESTQTPEWTSQTTIRPNAIYFVFR